MAGVVELVHVVAHVHGHLEAVSARRGPRRGEGTFGQGTRGHDGGEDPFLAPRNEAGGQVAQGDRLAPPGGRRSGAAVGDVPRGADRRVLGNGQGLDDQVRIIGTIHPDGFGAWRDIVVFQHELRHGVGGIGLHQDVEVAGDAVGDAQAAGDGVRLAGGQRAGMADDSELDVVEVAQGEIGGEDNPVGPRGGPGGLTPDVGDPELDGDVVATAARAGGRDDGRDLEVGQADRGGGHDQGFEHIGLQESALGTAGPDHRVVPAGGRHVHLRHAIEAPAAAGLDAVAIRGVVNAHHGLKGGPGLQPDVEEHRLARLHGAEVEVVQVAHRVDMPDADPGTSVAGRRQQEGRRAGNAVVGLHLRRGTRRRDDEAELVLGEIVVPTGHEDEVGAVGRDVDDRRLARAVVVGVEVEQGVPIGGHHAEVEGGRPGTAGVFRGQDDLVACPRAEAPPVHVARAIEAAVGGRRAEAVAGRIHGEGLDPIAKEDGNIAAVVVGAGEV